MRHLKPVRATIFLIKSRSVSEPPRLAFFVALGRVGTVEVGNMLVADVAEPVKSSQISFSLPTEEKAYQ